MKPFGLNYLLPRKPTMRTLIILPLLALFAATSAATLQAQEFTYRQIAWRSPSARVAQMMFASGHRQIEMTDEGDIWFVGSEGEEVLAQISPRGLFRIARIWEAPEGTIQSRFQHLTDSLISIHGLPDSTRSSESLWIVPGGRLQIHYDDYASENHLRLVIAHSSPTAFAEIVQRMQYRADRVEEERRSWATSRVDRARWHFLYVADSLAVSYDVTRLAQPSAGVTRLWLRWDNRQPQSIGRSSSFRYEHSLEQREVRCASRTWRVGAQHFYLRGEVVESASGRWSEWMEPIPDSVGEAVLEELCTTWARRR